MVNKIYWTKEIKKIPSSKWPDFESYKILKEGKTNNDCVIFIITRVTKNGCRNVLNLLYLKKFLNKFLYRFLNTTNWK